MSVGARLRRIRAILAGGVILRALGWGIATALTVIVGAALIDLLVPLSLGVRTALLGVAVLSLFTVAGALTWRDRSVLSIGRVALWVEERFPALEYALVTAAETGDSSIAPAGNEAWSSTARRRALGALTAPAIVLVVAALVVLILPRGAMARMRSPHPGDLLDRTGLTRGMGRDNRLSPLVADVAPPAYSGVRPSTLDEPSDVRTLEGSTITLRGRGSGDGIVAHVGADSIVAQSRGDRWSIAFKIGAKPAAIRLRHGSNERIVAVEPIADLPPVVVLTSPPRDSVLREAKGRIPLAADLSDDFLIASAQFELIVSSGEGETFTFKSGVVGVTKPNARNVSVNVTLSLDSLGLKPGDIVHLRAVARDANDVSGPGVGVSETRAIRIARKDEYDSVAVEAAASAEAEKGVISERMLIMLAEALQKKKPLLKHDAFLGESHTIAVDQRKLRRTVGEVVFTRLGGNPNSEEARDDSPERAKTMEELLARADSATNTSTNPIDFEGDETPVVAVNKPLLEAYNAMWDATGHLELGEIDRALPFMRRALDAIQRARKAERVYLRGNPPRVIVDVNKARLTGKDKGTSSRRRALTAPDSATQRLADRFTRIIELVEHDTRAATDSLLVLRIDALTAAPAFAAALSDAANAMRSGKSNDATQALARARRLLAGAPVSRDTLSRWGWSGGVP
jgi:hypothetical protein